MKTYRTIFSGSSEETKRLGEKFAAKLLGRRAATKHATVVILSGELGAGKTTFVQGFLKAAGIRRRAPSPTFVIMRRYRIRGNEKISNIFHVDAYRLQEATKSTAHLAALEFDKIVCDPKNIIIIEWGERIKKILPDNALWLRFGYDKKEGGRTVTMSK